MPRVRLTEHKAKQLLLGASYPGVALRSGELVSVDDGKWVLKVDQGVKKRFKQGLVALDQSPTQFATKIAEWEQKGFSRFVAEPMLTHEQGEERYLSLERVRDGIRLLYCHEGGIEIESRPDALQSFVIRSADDLGAVAEATQLPIAFLKNTLDAFEKNFFAFLEINPLVMRGEDVHLLDAAVLVDDAGTFFVDNRWSEDDLIRSAAKHPSEERISALQRSTAASLKLSVLHENGSLFFLLSGGGGSIVIADQAAELGMSEQIGNYGEYSGGPTQEETHLYAREVIDLLLASTASKKALIISGGVANFTDLAVTLDGIIDALSEQVNALVKQGVRVFVRRGGPNEKPALARLHAFLNEHGILGSVHGSEAPITTAIDEAIAFVR